MNIAKKAATWWNIKRVLETHCYSTITVPSKDGKVRTIRKAGRSDERQRGIYEVFGINYRDLPKFKSIFFSKK